MKPRKEFLDVHKFADELAWHVAACDNYAELLPKYGRALVQCICGPVGRMSLREAARRAKLSPTYLSNVMNQKTTISPGAYLRLRALLK